MLAKLLALLALLAVPSIARADNAEQWNGTVTSDFFTGEVIGLAVGGSAGLVVGIAALASKDRHNGVGMIVGGLVGAVVGVAVGIPVGGQIGGDRGGGSGRWYGTAIGTLAGDGIAVGIAIAVNDRRELQKPGVVLALAAVAVGPWLGYELTSNERSSTTAFIAPLSIGTF